MWVSEVSSDEFFSANRWTVSYFTDAVEVTRSAFPMYPLRNVAIERKGTADPQLMGGELVSYLGLENVRSNTGELIDFAPRPAASIKSRSKIFQQDDVLYGRLRPELNKVFLAQGRVTQGLCSGEFIVLKPNLNSILPRYLRHILASSFVTSFTAKYTRGASLPRMATDDLLGIEIPVPPLDVQTRIVDRLAEIDTEIASLRAKLEALPSRQAEAFLNAIASGAGQIDI